MRFRAQTPEYEALYRCTRYCYHIARPVLGFLPRTRESQKILVNLLHNSLADAGEEFSLSKQFLIETLKFGDQDLLNRWTNSYLDLAWLMVHENLSNSFAGFILENWQVSPYIIHHVPKSAGTSLCQLVYSQGYSIFYPQTNFAMMCQSNGLFGFGEQLIEFERTRQDRLYLSGHFNLPEMLASLGNHGRCPGVSLVRSPVESISSAIRYVWTMVEQHHPVLVEIYSPLVPRQLTEIREAAQSGDPTTLAAMREMVDAILQTTSFQENYDELLCQHYYNDQIDDIYSLANLFANYQDIIPILNPADDMELIRRQLRIEGELPRANASLFSHAQLVRACGGEPAFRTMVAAKVFHSSEIYGALAVMRSLRLGSQPPAEDEPLQTTG
jgi:hypothetical protein